MKIFIPFNAILCFKEMATKTVHYEPGMLLHRGKLSVGIPEIYIFFFYPFFKPIGVSIKFRCTIAQRTLSYY